MLATLSKTVAVSAVISSTIAIALPAAAQSVGETRPICVLSGIGDARVAGQEQVKLYGTDLGWTYERGGKIEILFGDTWDEAGATLPELLPDPAIPRDDAYGTIDLAVFPDGDAVEAACAKGKGSAPLIRYATTSPTTLATVDPGVAMDGLKTPTLSFSAGRRRESRAFSVFVTGKGQVCVVDPDCLPFTCDTGLGYTGTTPADRGPGLTFPCVDGSPNCTSETIPNSARPSGFCVDKGSSYALPGDARGRTNSVAWLQLVGVRADGGAGNVYKTREWLTNRFINAAGTTVRDFDPARKGGLGNDYRVAAGDGSIGEKLLIWARPNWVSLNAQGRKLHLYFAYADFPKVDGHDHFEWKPLYYTGVDQDGRPQFSDDQTKAAPLDLSGGQGSPEEGHDIVAHHSVRWIEPLKKWVMIYGGGSQTSEAICSTLSVECKELERGRSAVRMRTADQPWGPWSKPQDLIAGGNPYDGPVPGSQFVPGGMLAHPKCTEPDCAPRSIPPLSLSDTGAFYGANIIDQWTEVREDGAVDLYWNISTWNPYRVSLMKTRVRPK